MGAPCSSNVTHWSKHPISNDEILNKHINEIRDAIKKEYQRRGLNPPNDVKSHVGSELILRNHVRNLITYVENLYNYDKNHGYANYTISWHDKNLTNNDIRNVHINDLHENVNKIEYACLCNCNYCTCNCNYCTCNCNYSCTCNCNYSCTCNCNYSCTCNCNYSCTCNCNYCTCECNYCSCNCNY